MKSNFNKGQLLSYLISAVIIGVAYLCVPTVLKAQNCTPQGNWLGEIAAGGSSIRLGLHLEIKDTAYQGFLISPDQTQDSFDIDRIKWTGDSLVMRCKKLGLRFSMVMAGKCDTLKGIWTPGKGNKLTMNRIDVLPVMLRPQEPKPPYPYKTEEVSFPNVKGGFTLAGTLSMPNDTGRFPAVILITGSGAQDRNETLLGHKPFLVIADYLTRAGIAVLRYDDRGVGISGGDFKTATSYDFATDAQAAFDYLKTRTDIDPLRIGLAGHSEGGMIAPVVAAKNSEVAFVILLAGPGTTGKQILISQGELIARAENTPETEIQQSIALNRKIYDLMEKKKDPEKLAEALRALLKEEAAKLTPEERVAANLTDAAINAIAMNVSTPWFIEFVSFDPQPWLKKVQCRVLALNGENDLQVPCNENLTAIESAFKAGKCTDYTIKPMPGLNHLFQHCNSCKIGEYARIEETFSPEVLQIMVDWILQPAK